MRSFSFVLAAFLLLAFLDVCVARHNLTQEFAEAKKHAMYRRMTNHLNMNRLYGETRRQICGTEFEHAHEHSHELRAGECPVRHECDDPEVRDQYLNIDTKVTIRVIYNVLRDDNGRDPLPSETILKAEIEKVSGQLSKWFGITADVNIRFVDNNELRYLYISGKNCNLKLIGNKQCDKDCMDKMLAYDGGDCKTPDSATAACNEDMIGNGHCDVECNFATKRWDGGDCCSPDKMLPNCKEPGKKNVFTSAFNERSAFKRAISTLPGTRSSRPDIALNIFSTAYAQLLNGAGTFPTDPSVLAPEGGYFGAAPTFGFSNIRTSIHEIGHCFGLRHTFAGTVEVPGIPKGKKWCESGNSCIENIATENRDVVGDFCSDTPAEPQTWSCVRFESPGIDTDCNGETFAIGPEFNFMSYRRPCKDYLFTPQQKARARCYLDRSPIKAWIGTWASIDKDFTPNPDAVPPTKPSEPTASPEPTTRTPGPAPAGWTCDPDFYDAGDGCDCECGVFDPDCEFPDDSEEPQIFNCENGFGPSCNPQTAKCEYEKAVPAGWVCDPVEYDSLDGCDCECGVFDPDCNVNKTAAELFNCLEGGVCGANGKCQYLPPPGWVCPPAQYNDGSICNCNCGAPDIDCDLPDGNPLTVGCPPGQVCHLTDAVCVAAQERFDVGSLITGGEIPRLLGHSFVVDDNVCTSIYCDFEPSIAASQTVGLLSLRTGCPGTLVDVFSLDFTDYETGHQQGPSSGTIISTYCPAGLPGSYMLCGLSDPKISPFAQWTPINSATCTPSADDIEIAAQELKPGCGQFRVCQPFKYYGVFRTGLTSVPRLFKRKV